MAKHAGFLKRLKNAIGKGISKIATGLNKFVNTSRPIIEKIPIVGSAVAEVLDRTTNSANQFGRMVQGQITGRQFGNHIVDTYKSGALIAPYRFVRAAAEGPQALKRELQAQYRDTMDYFDQGN